MLADGQPADHAADHKRRSARAGNDKTSTASRSATGIAAGVPPKKRVLFQQRHPVQEQQHDTQCSQQEHERAHLRRVFGMNNFHGRLFLDEIENRVFYSGAPMLCAAAFCEGPFTTAPPPPLPVAMPRFSPTGCALGVAMRAPSFAATVRAKVEITRPR